ncbi:MAG: bifunctional metallophosphatase/5'-nucleotidase [Deltaproteobacteria bacterium]|nr:MAG: bifunctional metallophosphatase/5'-nucleotidase [Deltaproteobacteria bacterium]
MHPRRLLPLALCGWLFACAAPAPRPGEVPAPPGKPAAPARAASQTSPSQGTSLTVFFTTDEHGQLLPREKDGETVSGAVNLTYQLERLGYHAGDPGMLLLSGGDSWTGPAVSTYFQGASTVEVFNLLGYDAAALGNHDLDFGQATFTERARQAHYPILAANVHRSDGGKLAGLSSFVVVEVHGTRVGIVGLGNPRTPHIALAENVAGLRFDPPGPALRETVPMARAAGAQVVLALTHLCGPDLLELTPIASELDVAVMLGGHCHEEMQARKDGVLVVEGGHYLESVYRLVLRADPGSGRLLDAEVQRHPITGAPAAAPSKLMRAVGAVVSRWEAKVQKVLGQVIGYSHRGVDLGPGLYAMVTDAWLAAIPQAQIALSNTGAFRQAIAPGSITLADVLAVLPFENTLILTTVTGRQLLENLACCGGAVAGLTYERKGGVVRAWLPDGKPLDPSARYRVLINSFMYGGGDGYLFGEQDPNAEDTSIHWRDPVIDWIRRQHTSEARPLEALLDQRERFRPSPRPTEGAPAE